MKKISLLTLSVTLMLLNGCVVKSLHPFYTEKDVIFNEELLGQWIDDDSTVWKIEQSASPSGFLKGGFDHLLMDSYVIKFGEPESIFNGTLFRLNDIYYLDFFPMMSELFDDEFYSYHLVPTHSLAKVEFLSGEMVKISWFNEAWLTELFEQNKIKIAHEKVNIEHETEVYVLTASTRELQKFITKYGDDPDIYKCDNDGVCITLRKSR
jgi:hypothetical protein